MEPSDDAPGVTIQEVAVYQGVKRPIMQGGQASSSTVPIVAGRPALFRVFVKTGAAFKGGVVDAKLTIGSNVFQVSMKPPVASADATLSSTFNFDVPAAAMTIDAAMRIELKQATAGVTNPAARYPATGPAPLGIESSGTKLRVVLVPVKYLADGSGRLPDTSAAQVALHRTLLLKQFPVPDVEVTVHAGAAVPWSQAVNANGTGWDTLLAAVRDVRTKDAAESDVYYLGLVEPRATFSQYCGSSCQAGLSYLVLSPSSTSKASVILGYTGATFAATAVHEIGHAHGRAHAPCGATLQTDPAYPYAKGSIGSWGYDIVAKTLLSPATYTDVMGYCNPSWVSDYTYQALFDRLKTVNMAAWYFPSGIVKQEYARVIVRADGTHTWLSDQDLDTPPVGESVSVEIQTTSGPQNVLATYERHAHLDSGVLLFPKPIGLASRIAFTLDDRSYEILGD